MGDTPLHVHASKWNASFVNGLVEHGADVNAVDTVRIYALIKSILLRFAYQLTAYLFRIITPH